MNFLNGKNRVILSGAKKCEAFFCVAKNPVIMAESNTQQFIEGFFTPPIIADAIIGSVQNDTIAERST